MRKSLYNIVCFIFHIMTLVLLSALCIHFELIKLDFITFSKDSIETILYNDYVVNIVCTVLTALALYYFQIKYSKYKLKNDFRCNEIIRDVYDGIERTYHLINSSTISDEAQKIRENTTVDFDFRRIEEAQIYYSFYQKHRVDFGMCNFSLTCHNNWILIDSVQTVFFINLNFKLLSIVNNIKNRKPNLETDYPKIEELFHLYEKDNDAQTLIQLGEKVRRFLVDIDFMAKYWLALLNYLGYDPMPVKLYSELFKKEYPEYKDNLGAFFNLPIIQQNRMSRKVHRKTMAVYYWDRLVNFFVK